MRTTILLLPILLAGCAFSAANHQLNADGKYTVNASGNMWDTEETLLKTINKRAKKICGNENYKILGSSDIVESSVNTGLTVAPVRTLTRTISCGNL